MPQITDKRIKELERKEAMLNALDAGGVDNWEFYDESLKEYRAINELEEKRESLLLELESVFGECAFEPSERGAGIAFTEDLFDSAMKVLNDCGVIFKEVD